MTRNQFEIMRLRNRLKELQSKYNDLVYESAREVLMWEREFRRLQRQLRLTTDDKLAPEYII